MTASVDELPACSVWVRQPEAALVVSGFIRTVILDVPAPEAALARRVAIWAAIEAPEESSLVALKRALVHEAARAVPMEESGRLEAAARFVERLRRDGMPLGVALGTARLVHAERFADKLPLPDTPRWRWTFDLPQRFGAERKEARR